MTIIFNELIVKMVSSTQFTQISNGVGIILTAVVVLLLLEKAIMETRDGVRHQHRIQAINTALIPLMIAFFMVAGVHLAAILR